MKIRTTTSVAGLNYSYPRNKEMVVGVDVTQARANELIGAGYATQIPDPNDYSPSPAAATVAAPAAAAPQPTQRGGGRR